MSRFHGRRGCIYLAVHNGDQPSLLTQMASWSIVFAHDTFDATTLADTQKVWGAGLPDASGSFTGFLDDSTSQTYIAATDGLPRGMYLYPSSLNTGTYFSGNVLPDLAATGGENAPVTIAVTWVSATAVTETLSTGTYTDSYTGTY